MKLFRRFLLSLFSPEINNTGMNPVGMFVGFISPKQFFSVINRRVVENYKLNLFDICLDPFEIKIGFGDQPSLQVKEVDLYYSYAAVANLNGRTFYNPWNLATVVSILTATVTKDSLKSYSHRYAVTFFVSIYLLTFLFAARIRVFPDVSQEEKYQRFIELVFNFYVLVLEQQGKPVKKSEVQKIRNEVLQNIQLFFFLYYFYQKMNDLFASPTISQKEFYQRLFYEELRKWKQKQLVSEFVILAKEQVYTNTFTESDKELLKLIFPADVQIRYLFQGKDRNIITEKLLCHIFDMKEINKTLLGFLKSDAGLDEFLQHLLDYKVYKNGYFQGVRRVTSYKFRMKQDFETAKEIDDFMSTIEESWSIEGLKVPEKLKQEWAMMDRLLNFYVTFMGGLRVGRGDNFYLRLLRKPLIDDILQWIDINAFKQDALYYYGGLLYNYSKNVFYYKYAFENVRAGNESFSLPLKSSFKEVYSNMFILKLFDENFINTLLQDINKKSIKIYITNPTILNVFKNLLGDRIAHALNMEGKALIDHLYERPFSFVQARDHIIDTLHEHLRENDMSCVKDNLYTLDVRLRLEGLEFIARENIDLSSGYGDMGILGIIASIRETILGFLLFYFFLQQEPLENGEKIPFQALKKIYCIDVLNLSEQYYRYFDGMIEHLIITYHSLFEPRINLDDNKAFLSIGANNRKSYSKGKAVDQLTTDLSGDDVVRFRGFLKSITYYNKRYIIPK